jgi:hypothetical protein
MPRRRSIDERDIDDLLASLTDRQIAGLFDIPEAEVAVLRRERRQIMLDALEKPDETDRTSEDNGNG